MASTDAPYEEVYLDVWFLSERLTGLAEVDGSGSARLNERQAKLDMTCCAVFHAGNTPSQV